MRYQVLANTDVENPRPYPPAVELLHERQLPQHCVWVVIQLRDGAPVQRQLLQQRQAPQHLRPVRCAISVRNRRLVSSESLISHRAASCAAVV